MEKKVFTKMAILVLCMVILVIALPPVQVFADKPIVLKAVTFLPQPNNYCEGMRQFIKKVTQRSNGMLTVNWIGGPESISIFQQGAAVQSGMVDMAYVPGALYGAQVPAARLISLSMLTPQEERRSGAYDLWNQAHNKAGIYFLGRGYVTQVNQFNFFINKKVEKSSDFKGMRCGPGTILRALQNTLGVTPVKMQFSEMYGALERGVIDGVVQPVTVLRSWGCHEVAKYRVEPALLQGDTCFIVNLKKWKSLSKKLQDLMIQAVKEVQEHTAEFNKELRASEWQKLQATGMKIIEFSPDDSKWFKETCYEVEWKDQSGKVVPEIANELKKRILK